MSKDSSIKVFAENASGTRPANAIPVWIDNISAIGGGGGGSDFDPTYMSAQIDNKLNKSEVGFGGGFVSAISGKTLSADVSRVAGSALTAFTAQTAYYDVNGNNLNQTYSDLTALNDFVKTNSANWEGGSSDTFYIYPGKTTDKEISENSAGKDMKLYNSANNTYLDYAGKSTYSNYALLNFKEVTGTQGNQNTVQHLRLKVYPAATSACKVYDTTSVNLLDSNTTVNYANTAYYDGNGNNLTQTYSDLTALNSFVQSNSANWEGGSSPASEGVLFHVHIYQPSDGSKGSTDSYIANASDLYFEASVDSNYSSPNNIIIEQNGSFVGEAYWTQVSSDGSYNYYTASYNGLSNGEYKLNNNGYDAYYWCYVSAKGVRTDAFNQGLYKCSTDKSVKFNVQGYNITGSVDGQIQGQFTSLTSFTGNLTDLTAKGYEQYGFNINAEDYYNDYSYDLSAEFGAGGSTVASSDVFPPTNNLDPYSTYYLGWNANNGGLFWYNPGNGGN